MGLAARLALVMLVACMAACDTAGGPPRNYRLTLRDTQQQPLLEAEVVYLGKHPPAGARVAHDWRRRDTDFYRTTLRNRSAHTIELQSIRYAMARGPLHSPALKDRAGIAADYGSATLRPGDVIVDHDSYVWARRANTLQRTLQLSVDGRPMTLALPLRYRP